jgi:hypothetical protein
LFLIIFSITACKKDLNSTKEANSNLPSPDYTSVIKKYNYIAKSKTILGKHNEFIVSDSIPIILDLLLNYNATENSQNLENMELYEFQCDFPVDAENMSSSFVIDSLYDVIYEEIEAKLSETMEANQVIYFVSIYHDGRVSDNLKGITVLMKKGYGELQVVPKVVPSNVSYRAHVGIEESFGSKVYRGGQCGQFVNLNIGAPTILKSYGNYNLNLWQPSASPGYKYIYAGDRDVTLYAQNEYDPNHPTFTVANYINNIPGTFYPTKIYACATANSWLKSRNEQDPNPANHYDVTQAPCINSNLMNYYLSSLQEMAIKYKVNSNERAVFLDVVSNHTNWNNCVLWNSNPNPVFQTGLAIDNGICPQGQHIIGIKYKNLEMVPVGL